MARFYRRPVGRRPFRPRYAKRRSMRPGASWSRYGAKAGSMAYSAWRGVQALRSLINVEHQKIDFTQALAAQNTTPTVTHLSAVAVGDAEGSRTGNSLLSKYVYLKYTAQLNASANFTRLRVVVVIDKQQVGDTAPTYTDVYESVSTQALLNKATVGRFTVIHDYLCDLDANNPQVVKDVYLRLNHHIRYNGTASTDIQKGGIYLLVVSDQATNTPLFGFNIRLMYIDN